VPNLSKHQSSEYTKLLLIGDSKSGKTGSLASLVKKYKLRILDFDNGLDILAQIIRRDNPEALANVEFRSLRDKMKSSPLGPVVDGQATAYIEALKMLDHWKFEGTDLGSPAQWGPECVLVLDSLTLMGQAAMNFREPLVPRSRDGHYDKRAVYGDAQSAIEKMISYLTSEWFKTNVIVISHIRYVENQDGTRKGYPSAVGAALSPQLPRFFNSVALAQTSVGGKRQIQTAPTALIDLANPASFKMLPTLPIETGLAVFFETLRS
jgi:AAA domain-containing protein